MRTLAILGATGSIGASALDVVRRHPQRFSVGALTAGSRTDALLALCREFEPVLAVVADPDAYCSLAEGLRAAGLATRAAAGAQGLVEAATLGECDTVLAAIVGAAGLESTLAAAHAGKRLLLANKEAVVIAGPLLREALRASGGELIPVDSEHNAIFQCLPSPGLGAAAGPGIRRLLLTASGGPFRGCRREELRGVTPEQACAHPNWSMGRKISVDSATLMNKGLEVIEAHWLFDAPADAIEVVVHPQSIVHSLVEFADGSTLAQLGNPDMRTALAHALAWPDRIEAGVARLDLVALRRLEFEAPDRELFPCLGLAYQALRAGPAAATVLNAANEVAVSAFLQRELAFLAIAGVIEACLEQCADAAGGSLPQLLDIDARARQCATAQVRRLGMNE